MRKIISGLLMLLTFSITMAAEDTNKEKKLYKWKDKQGNLHYSDKPQTGAEEIEMKLAPSTKILQASPKPIILPKNTIKESNDYDLVSLSEPLDNGVIRNNTSTVTLTANLSPALKEGHSIRFFLDGKPINGEQGAVSVEANDINIGEHSASLIIINEKGNQIGVSKTIHFQLLKRINPAIRQKQKASRPQFN